MKILLVSSNTAVSPYPVYPLGLSIVAAALSEAGHEVKQFDFLMEGGSTESVVKAVKQYSPDLVGISIRNIDNVNMMNEQCYIDTVRDIVNTVRPISDCKVIVGGAGFSLIPELILQRTGADYGIVGEGEVRIVDFVNNAARGIYPESKLIGPGDRLSGEKIPSPSYDATLIAHYLKSGNIVPVQTKRGCTQKCIYCTYPILEGSRIRQRDVSSVVDDIKLLSEKHHAGFVFFVDSVFNDDEGAYIELIEEMLRRKVNVPWTGFFKPKGINDEIVEIMKKTGLLAVEIGSDAACDTTLRKLGKGFTFQDIVECNDLFARHEVATSHYFMFGGPGEDKNTVHEGIENIKNLKKCVVFIFMGIRIFPETPLARIAVKENVISSDNGMLEPAYYISPKLDRKWLEQELTEAFEKIRHCVFPPDMFDNSLRMLHKLGYIGTLWDMLLPNRKHPTGRQHAAK